MSDASAKAFVDWLKATGRYDQGYDIGQRAFGEIAFEAGWQARKGAQYLGLDESEGVTPIPAFLGPWVPPAENPRDKHFKATAEEDPLS
jgi:hypothetical protein